MTLADRAVWEHFAHGADIGIRGIGPTKGVAFQQIALALTAVVADPLTVKPLIEVRIDCEAPDDDVLLVDWLNAIIYEMATRRMLFSAYVVAVDNARLHGAAWGERIDATRHELSVEVKGATYTALRVEQREDGHWLAQCVVDV